MEELVLQLSNNYSKIIDITTLKKHKPLYWGGNGVGNRWANKKFNYSVLYSNKTQKQYSENINDEIPQEIIDNFIYSKKTNGIIGIYVYSLKTISNNRPISNNIKKIIHSKSCIVCGSFNEIVCDHKNSLYNDIQVLNIKTQTINDFQPLCNHCNLQKRQVNINEEQNNKIYSAKNIERYKSYTFEFPWEKKCFNKTDIYCKNDTYWFDPNEFENKIFLYMLYTIPIINALKHRIRMNKLKVIE